MSFLGAAASAVPSIMLPTAKAITSSASAAGLLGGSSFMSGLSSFANSNFGSQLFGSLAGAASSGLGGILNYQNNKKLQKKSYRYALLLQRQQQEWMERMSNTAHQREVKDLRAAGLNPILSAMGGNGASVGSASGSPVSAPSGQMFDFDSVVQSAISAARHFSQSQVDSAQARSLLTDAANQTARTKIEQTRANQEMYATNLKAIVDLENIKRRTSDNEERRKLDATIASTMSLTNELIARERNETEREINAARLVEERRRFTLDERRFMFDKQYRNHVLQLMRGDNVRGWVDTLSRPVSFGFPGSRIFN